MRTTFSTVNMLLALAIFSGIGGCSVYTQTTSGQDWLAAYPAVKAGSQPNDDINAKVRMVAAVEPTLRFPARIGIARLGRAGLAPVPSSEAEQWMGVANRLGPAFGEFVPVSPMIASMVEQPVDRDLGFARRTIDEIRLAAARQHLDAVLIYEADATSDAKNTPLSLAEWTLIGAFVLPTQNVKAIGIAQAMLIDVRNGYPYGTIQSSADDKSLSTRVESGDVGNRLRDEVMAASVGKLTGEAEDMIRKLKPELTALDVKPKSR